ncbi:MAG: hypothetical protein Q7T91_12690 [Sulfuricurvum sp.]|nr:hypothetical protein [Sulfuricurvum sp.]
MKTTKPRITISLEQEHYELLNKLSLLQHRPMSKIVVEFLNECMPILSRVADAIENVQKMEKNASMDLFTDLDKAEKEAQPMLENLMQLLQQAGAKANA